MDQYLGIDIGTSACKAVVFDECGVQLAGASREYPVRSPQPGWAELAPDPVVEQCFGVIREVAGAAPGGSIRGMGISSQGEAFTALDGQGACLCNAMISSDTRAAEIARSWPESFGTDRLYHITGHTAHPMFSLFKLLWLRDRKPDIWRRAERFLCFEDLLVHRLELPPAMGWPMAGRTMLFDVQRHEWSPEILDAVGLSPDQLARPLPSGTAAGTIPPDMAGRLGLDSDVLVVVGGHDQPCGALGAGAVRDGVAMYATGTVECVTPAFATPVFTRELRDSNLCTYDHTTPGMYATVAFSLTGGNILQWFRDQFGQRELAESRKSGRNTYEVLLDAMSEQPAEVMVLPYFTPTGTPHFDTEVKGAILGVRMATTRGEILRALLEGVAFEMRLNLDILERSGCEIRELRVIGGGAKSQRWNQLKADVLGKPLTTLSVTEAGCLGVAMLACAAHRQESVVELAESWVCPVATVHPHEAWRQWYDRRFEEYTELYPALRPLRINRTESQDSGP